MLLARPVDSSLRLLLLPKSRNATTAITARLEGLTLIHGFPQGLLRTPKGGDDIMVLSGMLGGGEPSSAERFEIHEGM